MSWWTSWSPARLAAIYGSDGWDDIVDFGEVRKEWLRSFLALPNGIPSADAFRRVFNALDPEQFGRCFASIVAELAGNVAGKQVCVDGKTMRRTFARDRGQGPLCRQGARPLGSSARVDERRSGPDV